MRVLVIEEELNSAKLLQKGLEAEYYAVDIALNGKQGLKMAESGDYDVIILNLNMSDLSGREIISFLREHDIDIPIISITEKGAVDKKLDVFGAGCDDFITRPFHFEELAARMRAILRRRGFCDIDKLVFGNLELDTMAHEVRYKEKIIELRNREFDLLEYLMRNSGRVVTRNMVLEHVWDINADSFSNTIEVHVTHLRKKLGEGGKMIKTVRGVGYKLVAI